MLNNPLPSPLYTPSIVTDPDTLIDPVNWEPLIGDVTINDSPFATDAVALPLAIKGDAAATTFCNCEPSPINVKALTLPLTSTEPVNSEPNCDPVAGVITLKSNPFATDAVTLPLAITGDISDNSAITPVNCEPSPINENALTLPLTSTDPVNSEPNSEPVAGVITLKSNPFATDAVTLPLAINADISDNSAITPVS